MIGISEEAHVWVHSYHTYCTLTKVFLKLTEVFLTLPEAFPCFFLSCKVNARVKLTKTGHCTHSSTLVVICVVRLFFMCCSMYCLCVNVYCHRVTTQLQLINVSYNIRTDPYLVFGVRLGSQLFTLLGYCCI